MPSMHEPATDVTPLKTRDTILVQGLPRINYYLPVIVTLLAAVVVLAVLALLSVLALLNAFTQFERADEGIAGGSAVAGGMCGVLALLGFAGTAFFLTAVVRGVRDLWSPVQ